MKVADICTRDVIATARATSLQQAAVLMREHHVGSLVVLGGAAQDAQAAARIPGFSFE